MRALQVHYEEGIAERHRVELTPLVRGLRGRRVVMHVGLMLVILLLVVAREVVGVRECAVVVLVRMP